MAEENALTQPVHDAGAAPVATPNPTAAAASPRPPGPLRRTLDWFWRGRALKQLRMDAKHDSPAGDELAARARVLQLLGSRARNPAEALPRAADAAAVELYREAAYFAVRALAAKRGIVDPRPWPALLGDPWSKVAGSPGRASELEQIVEVGAFSEPWDLPKEQQALLADELGRVSEFLLNELTWRKRARDGLWIQRLLRVGGLAVLVLTIVLGARWFADRSERARDLAPGKPWRVSSNAGLGCSSPLQQCGDNTDFFFHTTEEDGPWIELDLGKPTRFTGVRVVNRRDCCFERAVPIILEVSNQQSGFRELARRTSVFSSWLATFPPTEARYVRLRVPARTVMHLAEIRVLR